jgi:hypothetical protein
MYFAASRADNFIHGRLRPVRLLPPARNKKISARPAVRATGNRAARNGPRAPHLYLESNGVLMYYKVFPRRGEEPENEGRKAGTS